MTEVGIPVYKARDTLPKALDSLCAQTKDMFLVCLSIDCDGEDYSDIIEEYRRRGLHIRVINATENGGPGAARQKVIDTTQCEFLIFMDSDDMLMPRAVEILTKGIRNNFDIIRSSFIREQIGKGDEIIPSNVNTITWFHGKIYRVKYLKEKNIRFLPGLRTDEDAYFNIVAWNSTEARGEIEEVTYIWRDNKNSLTRSKPIKEYFLDTYINYIYSQIEGIKKLHEINQEVSASLLAQTLLNIYYYYMKARFYKVPEEQMNNLIDELKGKQYIQDFLMDANNWIIILQLAKPGNMYENTISFYEETFPKWAKRLLT